MGLVIKNAITAEQQAEIVQEQENKAAFDDLRQQIKDEKTARSNADNNLNQNINFVRDTLVEEISARNAAETQIKADLQTETNQRTAADAELQNAMQTAISTETAARQTLETNLRGELSTAITTEQAAREQGLQDLEAAIMVAMGNEKRLQDIEDEALRRQLEAEAASQAAVVSELTDRLNTEIETRANEDTKLSNAINKEVTDRQAAVSQAQTTLNAAINKEVTDRQTAISSVQGDLTTAQNTLNAAITNEATARQNADSQLQTTFNAAIATETQNRTNALNTLDTSLKGYVDAQISSVEGNLNDFTAPTATADGKRGLVPSPPKGLEVKILTSNGWRPPDDATLTVSAVPSQVGTLTYNGGSQSPSWLNFDNKKLKIEGDTTGTNAQTYTVTFTPLDLYMWADTLDQTPKTATWKIDALKLAKPSAAVTEFTFNNAAQGISVSNFDNTYESQTGTVSATNVGNYSAVYKLRNKTNTTWSDSTTGDVTINWKINVLKLTKPAAATTTFTYDGNAKSLSVSNYNSTYENQTGTVSATDANSYSAVYKLKNTSNTHWADDSTADVTINWAINPMKLTKPTATVTEFDFDGATKNLSVSNYNSTWMNQNGTLSASAVGSYSAVYSLKNTTNTKWADNSTSNVTISWQIIQRELSAAQSSGFEQVGTLTYTGNSQTVSIKNYDANYHALSGTTSAINAGTYTAKISPKGGYTWSDGTKTEKSVSWTINPKSLTKPTATTTLFEYSGQTKTLDIKNYNSAYMTKTGTSSASEAGDYSVTFTLNSTSNYIWADSTTAPVTITWQIGNIYLPKPTAATKVLTYTGSAQTLNVSNYNSKYMQQLGTVSATDAGEYSVTYHLTNPAQAKWADESTDDIVINWEINRKKLTTELSNVRLSSAELTYTGDEQNVPLLGYDPNYHIMRVVTSASSVGDYITEISLLPNYLWDDGTDVAKVFCWKIKPLVLTKPTLKQNEFAWTGSYISITADNFNNFDSSWMKIGKVDFLLAQPSEISQGSYQCSVYLIQSGATVWEGNTTDVLVFDYKITGTSVGFNFSDFVIEGVTFLYNGEKQLPTVKNNKTGEVILSQDYCASYLYASTETIEGQNSNILTRTNVGQYKTYVSLRGGYCFADESYNARLEFEWQITPKLIVAPFLSPTEFEYDGNLHCPDIINYDSTYMTYTDKDLMAQHSRKNIGQYGFRFKLRDKKSTTWEDGSTDDIVLEWSIGMNKLAAPSMTTSTFTYDGNDHSPTFDGVDTNSMTLGGTTSAVNAGSYVATVSIKNTDSYVWDDSTSAAKEYTWKINRKPLTATQSTFSQSGTLTYTGSAQTVTINNYDANYHTLGGIYISTNAGEFVAQITPRDNYCWNDGTFSTKYVSWKINPIKIAKPAATATSFTYDKQAHALSIQNYNSDYMNQTGTTSATAAGNYSVVYSLKNTNNVNWADSSVGDVVIAWDISKTRLAKPVPATLSFVYDGKVKTVSFSNYDSRYMTQRGDLQATAAWNYSIYFDLIDPETTEWEDASTGAVGFGWEIRCQPIPAAYCAFSQKSIPTFTNNEISVLSTNYMNGYNSTYQIWSGTTSAVNAGEYTAKISPNSNYCWDTGTREIRTVTWKINPAQVAEPTVSADLTYNGSAQSPTLTGYNASKMELTGDTTKTDAGDYVLKVQPKENYVWSSDGTRDIRSLDWGIKWLVLTNDVKCFSLNVYFNGTEFTVSFDSTVNPYVTNFDSDIMTVVSGGTLKATIPGTYYFSVVPKNPNHAFSDTQREKILSWTIAPNKVAFQKLKSNGVFSYTGKPQTPFSGVRYALANDTEYGVVPIGDFITITGTTMATEIGNYSATFHLKYPQYSMWDLAVLGSDVRYTTDDMTFSWSIGVTSITAPTISTTYFDYNGSAKTVSISGFDSNTMTKSGTESASARGFYKVTFSLKDKNNTCWSTGGNADIVIEWAIGKKRVAKPTLPDGAATEFTYNGSAKTLSITGYDADTMTQTGYLSATDAGSYTVTFALKSTTALEYVWEDNSTANVSFSWEINKAVIPDVTLSQSGTLTYTGQSQTVTIKNFNASTMEIASGICNGISGNFTSTSSATAAGNYIAGVKPKANYVWADSTSNFKKVVWTINKKPITKPTASTLYFVYDGNQKSLTVSGYDSTYMVQSGDISATEAGDYSAVYSLKSTTNTQWSDGTVGDVSINWSIGSKTIAIPTVSPATQMSKGLTKTHSVTVSGFDSTRMAQSGTTSVTTGKQATYNVYFALKDTTNDSWYGGSKSTQTVSWTVNKKVLTAAESSFVQTSSVSYNGSAHNVTEACSAIKSEYIGEYYTVSNATQTAAGTYTSTITPTAAACWNDLSTTAKTVSWTINATNSTFEIGTTDTTITISAPPMANTSANYRQKISFTTNSDGDILLESSDYNVVRFTSEGFVGGSKTIASTGEIWLFPFANGEATITVTQQAGTGYNAVTKTLHVKVVTPRIFLTPSEIATLTKAGTLLNYMRIGDCFRIGTISGTVNSNSFTFAANGAAAFLIGFDHNSGIEGNNRAHFAIFNSIYPSSKTLVVKSAFSNYGVNDTQSDYKNSVLRESCSELYELLPTALKNVITACKKYCFMGNGYYNYVTDKIWVPSSFEVAGKLAQGASPTSSPYIEQYEYWANGNSKAFGNIYWTRDLESAVSYKTVTINTSGNPVDGDAQTTVNYLLPCFTIS